VRTVSSANLQPKILGGEGSTSLPQVFLISYQQTIFQNKGAVQVYILFSAIFGFLSGTSYGGFGLVEPSAKNPMNEANSVEPSAKLPT
jgi:hypothetical protein